MIELCPICSGTRVSIVHQRQTRILIYTTAADHPGKQDRAPLTIVRCAECGHLYNRDFDERLLPQMYGDNPLTNVPVHPSMIDRLTDLADWIGEEHYRGKHVLEIGGGSGHFAYALARKARDVTVFEPCLRLKTDDLGLSNIKIINRPFPDGDRGERAHFICCRQVIEHVISPIDMLNSIRAGLQPGGHAYLEVPSAEFVERHASPIDFCLQHVHYFSEANFRSLLHRAGFVVERKLHIKNGHDVGFLVCAGPASPDADGTGVTGDLTGRLADRVAAARHRLASFDGGIVLYGANSYGQAFLDLWPEVKVATVLDDNTAFAGYALCGGTRSIPIELSQPNRLAGAEAVVIAAYLHDEVIAQKLRQQGYRGRIFTLRPSPLPFEQGGMEAAFV
jgi:SAM-dependent methyltransferase